MSLSPREDSRDRLRRRRIRGAELGAVVDATALPQIGGLQGLGGHPPSVQRCLVYCRKSTDDETRQVASIQSQRQTLEAQFDRHPELSIVGVYEEARSAKTPGRPIFAEMMTRIERGEADCIIAWAPDRLARNSIDGGRIIYLLDQGVLRDLKFSTYTFENNSQGKFMLSIMFGQSKYYSDALSDNVKRGNRTKAAAGWRPDAAPFGYLNDRGTRTIVVDPLYFPLVRRMFDMVLTGGYSAREIARIARFEWELRTPNRRGGGKPIHHSMVHRLLTNPFYAGVFPWEGEVVAGQHTPVVSLDEFREVQGAIRRKTLPKRQRRSFPFVGLIKCGRCGHGITAQENKNRYGTRYRYYVCTYTGEGARCRQPAIRAEELERQVEAWLATIGPDAEIAGRIGAAVVAVRGRATAAAHAIRESVDRALKETQAQIVELTSLRLKRLIDDFEYHRRRNELEEDALRLARRLNELAEPNATLKPFETGISFSICAADWFRIADDQLKRVIVRAASSNLTLVDRKLSVEAAKWIWVLAETLPCPSLLGVGGTKANPEKADRELLRAAEAFATDPASAAQLVSVAHVVRVMSEKRPLPVHDVSDIDKRAQVPNVPDVSQTLKEAA